MVKAFISKLIEIFIGKLVKFKSSLGRREEEFDMSEPFISKPSVVVIVVPSYGILIVIWVIMQVKILTHSDM